MKMRPEQEQAFSQAAVQRFEDRMVTHLGKFFPEQCDALGEADTRAAIREGIQRAAQYDIISERDVCKFTDLMFAFGRRFDEDSKLPWARQVLADPAHPNATVKTNRLYDAALRHARQAAGRQSADRK